MRRIWAAAFLLRRLRAERGVVLLLVGLIGVTAFLGAAAPRLYNLVADAGLRREVAEASTARRNIELVQEFVMPPNEDPADVLDRLGRTYQGLFGDDLEQLIASRELVVTSPRFGLLQQPLYPTFVALRYQSGLGESVRLAEGRWPQSTGEQLPEAAFDFAGPGGEPTEDAPRIEIAISRETAEESGIELGQVLDASVDSRDPLLPRALVRPLNARLDVVGIFDVTDKAAPIWYSDTNVQQVAAEWQADTPIVYVTALIAPEAHPDLATSNLAFRYAWHYFIDPERFDAGQLETLVPEIQRLETTFSTSTFGDDDERIVLRSGLNGVIDEYLAQRAASEAVLSVAAIGPLALAAGSIGMLAVLLIARRRATLQLARGRGAATGVLLGAQAWEAAVLGGTAALLGLVLALVLVPGRASSLSAFLAVGTAVVATILLVGATWPAVRRPLDQTGKRDEPPPLRAAPRRLVLELTAVGLAVAGIFLLRQRGLAIADEGEELARFDPFLAAVPVLAGFAAGVVATRLYPFPIRALGWLAARRRDLVPVLGLRNIGRRPSFATLPLLVLMLTAAFGSFALVVTSSVDAGQLQASWREVGADYRIDAPPGASLADVDVAQVPGIGASASAFVDPITTWQIDGTRNARVHLAAIEPAAYTEVIAGSPLSISWPSEFLAQFPADAGSEAAPIPAIIARSMPAGGESLAIGTTMRLTLPGGPATFLVVDVRSAVPGLTPNQAFVVAPLTALEANAALAAPTNVQLLRGPAEAGAELAAIVERDGPASTAVASRHDWYADLRGSPLIAVVADGFRIGMLVAIAYAGFAVVTALTLTAARRTQDLAFLRTLGLSRAQAAGITVIEHATPVLVALVPGLATGIGVAILLEQSLGLDAFIGSGSAFNVALDWTGIAGVAGILLLVVAGAVVASTWLARRAPVVDALRVGEA